MKPLSEKEITEIRQYGFKDHETFMRMMQTCLMAHQMRKALRLYADDRERKSFSCREGIVAKKALQLWSGE